MICTPSPIPPAWTCWRRCSITFRPARRSRSPAGKIPRCRSPAGGHTVWWTRSAWRTSGWTSARPGCCSQAAGVEVDAGELSELTERTEGWPAGLYLAALSLQAGAPGSAGAAGFNGDDRFVSEYFRFELLSRLPPAEARFLQYTSVLDRMCGWALRRRARDDGVGTRARDGRARESLRSAARPPRRVVSLPPPVRPAAAQRARAQRAGRGTRTQPSCDGLVHRQRPAPRRRSPTGTRPVRRTPSPAWSTPSPCPSTTTVGWRPWRSGWAGSAMTSLRRYPALAVVGAWVRALTGRPADAERWLALADGATSTIPLSDGSATIEPWVATLRAHMMPNGVEQALADADLALNQLPPESDWVTVALLGRGVAHALLGATDRATDDLTAAVEKGLARGATEDVYLAQAQLALLAAKQGAWGEAGRRARRGAERSSTKRASATTRSSALAHVATARVALHEARQEDARAALTRAHRLRPNARPRHSLGDRRGRARAHPRPSRARARPAAARTILTETERRARAPSATWARSSRTHGSCAIASRRPPGRPVRGR